MSGMPSKRILLISLAFGVVGILLVLLCAFRVAGLYSYDAQHPLARDVVVKRAGTYSLCYEDRDMDWFPSDKLILTLTGEDGAQVSSQSVPPREYDRAYGRGVEFATIQIASPGTYKVRWSGVVQSSVEWLKRTLVIRNRPESLSMSIVHLVLSSVLLLAGVIVPAAVYSNRMSRYRRQQYALSQAQPAAAGATPGPSAGPARIQAETELKRRSVALLLAAFPVTGAMGFDRFYLGYVGMGLVRLFTAGGILVLWVVDIVRIAKGTMTDKRGRPLR